MEYVDWDDLTKPQRLAVLAHVSEPVPSWLVAHSFPVKKNGTVKIPMYPRISRRAAKAALDEMERAQRGDVPARPEKGDIHHLKTATFSLDRQK